MEELLKEQSKSRFFREGQTLASCDVEVPVLNVDELVKTHMEMKKKLSSFGPIFRYALSCSIAYNKLKEQAHRERQDIDPVVNPLIGYGNSYCGIDIRELEGLEDKMLMFQNRETMEEFLKVVDVNKTINLLSPKRAVEEAIKHFEFVGRINQEMKVEEIKDE